MFSGMDEVSFDQLWICLAQESVLIHSNLLAGSDSNDQEQNCGIQRECISGGCR